MAALEGLPILFPAERPYPPFSFFISLMDLLLAFGRTYSPAIPSFQLRTLLKPSN